MFEEPGFQAILFLAGVSIHGVMTTHNIHPIYIHTQLSSYACVYSADLHWLFDDLIVVRLAHFFLFLTFDMACHVLFKPLFALSLLRLVV